MARTLVGRLQILVEAMGLDKAKQVEGSIKNIETAAKRLSSAAWGVGFQKQLNTLALSARELDAVKKSWSALNSELGKNNLGKALKSSQITAWKTATLQEFAQVRSGMRSTEKEAQRLATALGKIKRTGLGMLGGYGSAYLAGRAGRSALTAASEQQRTKYRMELANIPPGEIQKMQAEASRLSTKYGSIDETDILELNKTTFAMMGGNGEKARSLMESIIQAFVSDVTAVGVDKAGENLSSFLKAMDNLNVNEGPDGGVENIRQILDGWTKAKQVEGKDVDVGEILGFARRAKVSKYALSDEFLTDVLPAIGQDMGFDALGDALSGAYQNLITPSNGGAQGQYVKRQRKIGLRDKDNQLVERDLFASNPYEWTQKVLKPILEKSGVDTNNTAAVSAAVKGLMSNSKAAAAIVGWIEAQQQIDKTIGLYKGAAGLKDAENARVKDPFAAAESVMASLRNLSAAVMPMETISAGLNAFADTINAFTAKVREQDPMVLGAAGVAGGAMALWGGAKAATGIWGLVTAGASLQTAATMLQAAAVAQGGGLPGGDVKKGGGGLLGWIAAAAGRAAPLLSTLFIPGDAPQGQYNDAALAAYRRRSLLNGDPVAGNRTKDDSSPYHVSSWKRFLLGEAAEPGWSAKDHFRFDIGRGGANAFDEMRAGMDSVKRQAEETGTQASDALSFTARPKVDMSEVNALDAVVDGIVGKLGSIGAAASAAKSNIDKQLRRAMPDFGVTP